MLRKIPTWRIFSISAFFFQLTRIPLAIYFVDDVDHLSLYLIVMSTTIPVQFYANEVLLFKGFTFQKGIPEGLDLVVLSVWVLTLGYLYVGSGLSAAGIYILFSTSLLLFSLAQYSIREHLGATKFLLCEMILNGVVTVGVLYLVMETTGELTSVVILLYMAAAYSVFFLLVVANWNGQYLILIRRTTQRSNFEPYLFQVLLMISTQLERLVIGWIWPTFLAYIAIIAAGTQAWRRVILDDSVLFNEFTGKNADVPRVVFDSFVLYWRSSLGTILFGVLGYAFLRSQCFSLCKPLLADTHILTMLAALGILYLNSLPAGIVAMNVVRAGLVVPSTITYSYLALIIGYLALLLLLLGLELISVGSNFAWLLILSTSLINVFIFYDVVRQIGVIIEIGKYVMWFFMNLCFVGALLYVYT